MKLHELEDNLKEMRKQGADSLSEVIVLSNDSKLDLCSSINKLELVSSYCIECSCAYDVVIKVDSVQSNEVKYYLQNAGAGYCGNALFWWAESGGYTVEINEAKLFTKEEAESVIRSTKGSHQFKMWEESKVLVAIVKIVDSEKLK